MRFRMSAGAAAARAVDRARPVRQGSDHRHRRAGVLRQLPVLHRPEYRGQVERDTPCHMDIPLRNCSVSLDGVPMTINGNVVVEEQKAA